MDKGIYTKKTKFLKSIVELIVKEGHEELKEKKIR